VNLWSKKIAKVLASSPQKYLYVRSKCYGVRSLRISGENVTIFRYSSSGNGVKFDLQSSPRRVLGPYIRAYEPSH
jgi:hypothetical protein